MRLFGKDWDRGALLARVGDVRQLGGAERVVLDDGPERGVRAIEVRTGTGFAFTVLPDRGMDVWRAEHRGMSLCWHSPTGPVAPAFFEPDGLGWLRGFQGGLLVTCGLTQVGPPGADQGKALGLHGRASYTPASDVAVLQDWEGDEYAIEIRGRVREASVFGENVRLTRRIRTSLGRAGFTLEDEVENLGHEPAPHMLLYHVNAGFPVVGPEAELLSASSEVKGSGEMAEREKAEHARFGPPQAGYAERVYFHRLRAGPDGRTTVALANGPFGYALRFPVAQMPCFTEWKMTGQGTYVVGTEPGNVHPQPRAELRAAGKLPFLQPGEKKSYSLEFSVLATPEDVRNVKREIQALGA
jgi:hypothetical protein